MVVLTDVFVNLAATAARARGYAALRSLVLPHPMETRPVDEIRAMVEERLAEIVGLLAGRA